MQEMIHYVYTGKFTGADLNVQMVAWVANKYDLPGMMDLLCFKMNDVEDENIADMLIAAGMFHNHHNNTLLFSLSGRHDSQDLKRIAINKLRKRREMFSDPSFRKKLDGHQNILFDLFQDF